MVEETEYDDVVQCDHSYDKRCHTTYVTTYESQQEEECEENYRKNCFIEYEKIAFNETVDICRTPLVKDCDVQGPEICRTEYESRPFDAETYEDEMDEDQNQQDEEGRTRLKLKVENTIRWRQGFDKEGNAIKESNARIVKWSDGSYSLHLGSEIFDVH